MARNILTAQKVERYKPSAKGNQPAPKDGVLNDGNGLYLRVRQREDGAWSRFWMYTYKFGSTKSHYIHLGEHGRRLSDFEMRLFRLDPEAEPELCLKNARLIAGQLADLKKRKIEPKVWMEAEQAAEIARQAALAAAERAQAAKHTVQTYFEDVWVKTLTRTPEGIKTVKRIFNNEVLPSIGGLLMEEVKREHLMPILSRVVSRGTKRQANICLQVVKQFLYYAVDQEVIPANPIARLFAKDLGGKPNIRTRYLKEFEIRLLQKRMAKARITERNKLAVWIALSTCCRIGEISRGKWEHLDTERWTWTIPAEHSKNKAPIVVILSEFARAQFEKLIALKSNDEWMFPNRKNNGHQNVKVTTRQITDHQNSTRVGKRRRSTILVLPKGKWNPHDLRRTGSTIMGSLGILPAVIERCLNHLEESTLKKTYQQYQQEREQMIAWSLLGQRLQEILAAESDQAASWENSRFFPQMPSAGPNLRLVA